MEITSSAFQSGELIPSEFTCEGKNVSPPLKISGVPSKSKSLVLIMDDVDAPGGVFTHWLVYDIFSGVNKIEVGGSIEGTYGKNDFDQDAYGGPCPNRGMHRYYFRIFALDRLLKLPWSIKRSELDREMKGHVIEYSELMGKYSK